ncbi:MAG: hypothetical protein A3F11_02855 [Gammaproteobacteria bacterium RIFCSPHIGHO2_12_FULL_37_14]|nr:MAG: hypothetical protein A3F11_02855 [Gammaproteobacteria bacterium RIFCSPHIGHO2_12_FULL_37_14]
MFKKLIVASTILAASSGIAFAGHSYKGEKDYKGEMPAPCPTYVFPTGPYVGLSVGSRLNFTGSPTLFGGVDGNLALGYSAMVAPAFYLAGEIFGIGTANVKDLTNTSSTGATIGAKSNWGYGASILPGYMITDYVLMYLRVGATSTHFNDQNVNKTAWHIGLGGETALAQNWDIRGEWVYAGYGNVSGIGNASATVTSVGLVYKFL